MNDINKTLHRLSHLKWLAFLWTIVQLYRAFSVFPNVDFSIIGNILYLSGIYLGLDSLVDSQRLSAAEKEQFRNEKFVRRLTRFVFLSIFFLIFIGVLFIVAGFAFPSMSESMSASLTQLGYDCLVTMLGMLCLLKSIRDKAKSVEADA